MKETTTQEWQDITKEATAAFEQLLEVNVQLTDENTKLKEDAQKSANQERVLLEKVAAPVYDKQEVADLVDTLITVGSLDSENAEKVASAIESDPSQLLKLAKQVATLSLTNPATGRGVEKTAYDHTVQVSASSDDMSGWAEIVRSGSVR